MTSMLSATLDQITLKSFWGQEPAAFKKSGQAELDAKREDQLVQILKDSGVPMTRLQMVAITGLSLATHDRVMERLVRQGRTEIVRKQAYNRTWGLK